MNGAQALLRTLLDSGVDVCFANPGTSEMHFVAALDDVPEALDARLESDIDAVAGSVSGWVRRSESVAALASDAAVAVGAARSCAGVATLILPTDIAWTEGALPMAPAAVSPAPSVDDAVIGSVAKVLAASGPTTAILVGGSVLVPSGADAIECIHTATGAKALHETFPERMTRGAGRFEPDRLAYLGEMAMDLGRPDLDFCWLPEGQGVPAVRVTTADDLCAELERAYREPGPHLIEAMFRPLG